MSDLLKEIDLNELQLLEDLGTGNFGVRVILLYCIFYLYGCKVVLTLCNCSISSTNEPLYMNFLLDFFAVFLRVH